MEKIWLTHYPKGVPAEIDVREYASIVQVFEESVLKYNSRPAYVSFGHEISYTELGQLCNQFAAFLQSKGLQKGDRVALMMPNLLQYPICLFGALKAGCVIVNVNPLYTETELEYQLKDSGAHALVVVANFAHTYAAIADRVPLKALIVSPLGEMLGFKGVLINFVLRYIQRKVPPYQLPEALSLKAALQVGLRSELRRVPLNHDDLAFLQYTGGTTGVSKGAMLLHRNIVANLLQARAWLRPILSDKPEIIITPLPLYHIFSLTANCLVFMTLGAKNVLIPNPRDLPAFIKELKKHQFTAITGVNTLYNALIHHPDFAQVDFSCLKIALGGGMAVQQVVAEKWRQITGCTLVEAYGLTETSPAVTMNPLNLPAYNGSIGLPIPSTEVILRNDNHEEVPLGSAGEIWVRGPQVMAGYWQKPDETAQVFDQDNWLATGDIGIMNEQGYIKIVDRKKDMIVVSGFKVYPNEIEAVVAQHPDVLEVAAIGVPDPKSGETVKIFVVARDPQLTTSDLHTHCQRYLTGYKVPTQIEFRQELPKTNVGKILRRALREENHQTQGPL